MQEIAEALKKQREAKGLSLDELFQRTRINIDFLKALEAGQFDVLPNTYAKLFVKKYAQEVGLNVDEILALYDQKAPREEPVKLPPQPVHRKRNFQPVIFIAVGVFIVALLVWQINQQSEQSTTSPLDATLPTPPISTQHTGNQPAPPATSQQVVQETQTAPQDKEMIISEMVDDTKPIESSNTPAENTTTDPIQDAEPLLAEPATQAIQPEVSKTETDTLANTQIEPLSTNAETTAETTGLPQEPLAEDIQPPPTETLPEQTAADPMNVPPVTQNQPSARPIDQDQRPETEPEGPITKPLPVQIAPGNPIILSGIVQQTTQIVVKADGRTLFDGELQTGSRPRWMARESLELTLTNQKAIELSLQNQPLQFDDITTQAIQLGINRTQINISPAAQ